MDEPRTFKGEIKDPESGKTIRWKSEYGQRPAKKMKYFKQWQERVWLGCKEFVPAVLITLFDKETETKSEHWFDVPAEFRVNDKRMKELAQQAVEKFLQEQLQPA